MWFQTRLAIASRQPTVNVVRRFVIQRYMGPKMVNPFVPERSRWPCEPAVNIRPFLLFHGRIAVQRDLQVVLQQTAKLLRIGGLVPGRL